MMKLKSKLGASAEFETHKIKHQMLINCRRAVTFEDWNTWDETSKLSNSNVPRLLSPVYNSLIHDLKAIKGDF